MSSFTFYSPEPGDGGAVGMETAHALECPELTILQLFLREELADDSARLVESHVVCCTACQAILENLVERASVERILTDQANMLFADEDQAARSGRATSAQSSGSTSRRYGDIIPSLALAKRSPEAIGEYRVIRELGRGANGIVYHAHDDALDRPVAIKVPHGRIVQAAGGVEAYLKEARTLARLDHPHIVRVYEVRQWGDGSCYIASQYIAGGSLAQQMAARRYDPVEAVQLLLPLADALQHAHEQGICHRDVKPANILLDAAGSPRLADFGLAMKDEDLGHGPRLLGTPAYMSPEQARGEGHLVDGRTDIYSLGAMFFKLLTGRRPFLSQSPRELLDLIAHVDAPSARQKNRLVPAELDRICAKAMARQLTNRYRSAAEFADELEAWLSTGSARRSRSLGFTSRLALAQEEQDASAMVATFSGDSTVSQRTIGGFQLRSRLGHGGMGIVYRAWQASADREVALKCIRVEDETSQARFLTEIRALGQVEHPNLVRVYTSGADGDRLYYAMELIAGTGFRNLIRQLMSLEAGPLDQRMWRDAILRATDETRAHEDPVADGLNGSYCGGAGDLGSSRNGAVLAAPAVCVSDVYVRNIVEIMRSITRAAQALHEKGVVHRDIKPENILLSRDGDRPVLMDLGIAKLAAANDGCVTRTREFVGTLRYASPEQVIDSGEVDHRSDIYSLGATLWELLTLRPMFGIGEDISDARAMLKIEIEEPQPVRKYNRAVSTDLQAVVQRCLEKDPERRYQSAAELAEELDRVLDGRPVEARPVGALARLYRRCRRRPLVPSLALTIAMLGAALVAVLVPPPASHTIRVGIKPWVGFSPLVVAAELGLCEEADLELVPVQNTTDVRRRILSRELDVAPYLVDSHALARSTRTPTKAILQFDVSLTADAMVARAGIRSFADLKGQRIAYMHHEAPHFLLLSLCERFGLDPDDFEHVKSETAKGAVDLFLDNQADAVVSYEPFLQAALAVPGAHRLASAADEPGTIIDILVAREDYLESDRHKIKGLIAAWFEALDMLERGDPQALNIACRFLGTEERPLRVEEYHEMAAGMQYGDIAANLAFLRKDSNGRSEFHDRFDAAQSRWDRYHQLGQRTDPATGDGSDVFLEMYGP